MRQRKRRLFSILFTIGGVLLGAVFAYQVARALEWYFIPPWQHTEIDSANRTFREIVWVDYGYLGNGDLSQDNVMLRTEAGDYYSYHQAEWQLTDRSQIDETEQRHSDSPCDAFKFSSPPPPIYLRRARDSVGIEIEHALAITSRCYILLGDGSLHSWTRDVSAFDPLWLSVALGCPLAGMIAGGIIGAFVARRKYR
jgi:hypothetical protein